MFLVSDLKKFVLACEKANLTEFDIDPMPKTGMTQTAVGARLYETTLETASFNVVIRRFIKNPKKDEPVYSGPSMLTWTDIP